MGLVYYWQHVLDDKEWIADWAWLILVGGVGASRSVPDFVGGDALYGIDLTQILLAISLFYINASTSSY
jgi:hypothetical protein